MITKHALERTQERTGLNAKDSRRFVENAIKQGKRAEDFTSKKRNYLLRQEAKKGYRALLYNEYCFILDGGNNCVTMYLSPEGLGEKTKKRYNGKSKIRDFKKYIRYYDYFKEERQYGVS